jgi:hypothetical protein
MCTCGSDKLYFILKICTCFFGLRSLYSCNQLAMNSLSQNKIPIKIKRNPNASELRLSFQFGILGETKAEKVS